MKLPEPVKPIWRTIQVIRISKGLDDGLRLFIVGPYFYEIFKQIGAADMAMLYTSVVWSIYFGLSAFMEIPTGVLADVFGRVYAVILCFICNFIYALGLASLVIFNKVYVVFALVVLVSIIRAMAVTFYNGSFSAWVVDSLRERAPDFGYERLFSRGYVHYSCAMIVGAAMGVTLYLYGVAYVAFVLGAVVCLSCTTYCVAEMKEPHAIHFSNLKNFWIDAGTRMGATLVTALRVCHQVPVLKWLLLSFGCYGFFANVVLYLWPIVLGSYYGTGKWSIQWYVMAFGVPATTAVFSQLLTWAGNHRQAQTGQKLTRQELMRWMYLAAWFGSGAILILAVLPMWRNIPFWLFAWGVLSLLSTNGVVDSCYSALMHEYIPRQNSKERATILSVGSMLQGLLVLIFLIPSSMPSHAASVVGWLLPAMIFVTTMGIAQLRIRKLGQETLLAEVEKLPEREAI